MHNLCILAGLINVGISVVTIICGGAVGIAVAVCGDSVCVCSSGHIAQSKILIVCRNGREICSVNGGLYKTFPCSKLKRSGVIEFLLWQLPYHPRIFTQRKYQPI